MGNCCTLGIKVESPSKGVTSSEALKAESELQNHKIALAIKLPPSMMIEIFSRLPARSISRLRAGCKLWNTLINDHYFAHLQLKNCGDRNKPIIITVYKDAELGIFLHRRKAGSSLYEKIHLKFNTIHSYVHYSMTNSCNGLICILGVETAFLVNITTAESVALPNGTPHYGKPIFSLAHTASGGIVYDISKAEYKIVRLFFHSDSGVVYLGCEILILGSVSWRRICLKKLDGDETYALIGQAPVLIDDNLYWTANLFAGGTVVAIAFETKSETIDVIQHPEGAVVASLWSSAIGNLSGRLYLADIQLDGNASIGRYNLNIWVLADYKQRRWVKHCTIKENPVPCGFLIRTILDGIIMLRASRWKMFSIDIKDSEHLWKTEDTYFDDCISCVESLISPVACHSRSQTMSSGERVLEVCVDCKCLDAKFSARHRKLHNIVL